MKKRIIAQEIIFDDRYNSLSLEAQNLFVRMLVCSDDYGIVPANLNTLKVITNFPLINIELPYNEIIDKSLGKTFVYNNNRYFVFNPSSFYKYQKYIIRKRTKSEYLYLLQKELSEKIPDIFYQHFEGAEIVESLNSYKDISIKFKEGGVQGGNFDINEIEKYFENKGFSKVLADQFYNYNSCKSWKINKVQVSDWKPLADLYISKQEVPTKSKKPNGKRVECTNCGFAYYLDAKSDVKNIKCSYCETIISIN